MKAKLVKDWMTAPAVAVTPKTKLPEAYRLMVEHRIRRLPVLDNGKLVGIVSLGDMREAEVATDPALAERMTIALIVRSPVITVSPATKLKEAAAIMLEKKISGLPVVDGDAVVGMVTESDVFRAFIADQG